MTGWTKNIVGEKMKCIRCGKEILCRSSSQKYCPECGKWARKQYVSKPQKEERFCTTCGAPLTGNRTKTCDACAAVEHMRPRECRMCGKMIAYPRPNQIYCSDRCKAAAKRKRAAAVKAPPVQRSSKVCSRARGKKCIWWRKLEPTGGGEIYCCHYILYNGKSTGWKDPCDKCQPKGVVPDGRRTDDVVVTRRKSDIDNYEYENAYKRW